MAEIQVSNFNEFLTAAQNDGDTIICPENAIWDLSIIDPENDISTIEINSSIIGNNTEIHNFRGKIICDAYITITALHIINQLCEVGGDYNGAIQTSQRYVYPNEPVWRESKLSIATGADVEQVMYNIRPIRCAMNFSMLKSGVCYAAKYNNGNTQICKYNRLLLNAPNATSIGWDKQESSEFILNAPNATRFDAVVLNSTIRGNIGNIQQLRYISSDTNVSVVNSTDAPNFPTASWILKATDEQMKDANYLEAHGFIIGTE